MATKTTKHVETRATKTRSAAAQSAQPQTAKKVGKQIARTNVAAVPKKAVAKPPTRPKAAAPKTMANAPKSSKKKGQPTKRSAVAVSIRVNQGDRSSDHESPTLQDTGAGFPVRTRNELGVTQELFARMLGVSARSIAGWEAGRPINEVSQRRIKEMDRLASALREVMHPSFIPKWLTSQIEGLGGLSPVQVLERGENDRLWRTVFLLGSGLPI